MEYVSKLIESITDSGNTLILVDRTPGNAIVDNVPGASFVSGSMKTQRGKTYDEQPEDPRVLVATYGVAAVGINIPVI